MSAATEPLLRRFQTHLFAANDHHAYMLGDLHLRILGQLLPEAGWQAHHIQLIVCAQRPEPASVGQPGVVAQYQCGTADERAENLLDGCVEVDRGELQRAFTRAQPGQATDGQRFIAQPRMFKHHPLGHASGAGGVDHVSEVCRAQAQCSGVRIVVIKCRPGLSDIIQHYYLKIRGQLIQTLQGAAFAKQSTWRAVLKHVRQAFRRVGRVQRYIGRTCLEGSEQGDNQARTALECKGNALIGTDT